MSLTVLGKRSSLLLGHTAANKSEVAGVGAGTENIGAGYTQDTRPVPGGRGVLVNQLGDFTTSDFSLATDSNALHDPLFRSHNGRRFYFTWRPEGAVSGLPEYTGEAVGTVSLTFDLDSDAVTWAVGMAVDGEPVEGVQVAAEAAEL